MYFLREQLFYFNLTFEGGRCGDFPFFDPFFIMVDDGLFVTFGLNKFTPDELSGVML